ncbi:sugar transferase [Pseudoalteromonas lipolytica]|jgi:undecaprenyl phosphate N,N'-diacetylbacillosamine 1-phosphate transferase|uniref:sugar transferase n=1 Tax=Pseudoalteromonas lipolytica TaxID=570156 RepID=UPI000824836C|nr:sugar transferase [Pseudoalteromonas lipolytica]
MYRIFFKPFLDFIIAAILLILLSPIILVSFIFIKFEDPSGPVLFKQKRIGKNTQEFSVFKLRSMKVRTHDISGRELTDHERMLRFGQIFRKLSIDELPQLVNILKGEMSFIGPRPLPIIYGPYYTENENRRHEIKPGISGWAQVNGRNSISWEDKFKLDLEYVEHIGFVFDIKIAFLTVYKIFAKSDVVVRGENTNIDFHTYREEQNNGK